MNEEILQKLYKNASQHFSMPDYDTFKSDMSDEQKVAKFRDNMSKHYDIPDLDTFKADIGLKKKFDPQSFGDSKKLFTELLEDRGGVIPEPAAKPAADKPKDNFAGMSTVSPAAKQQVKERVNAERVQKEKENKEKTKAIVKSLGEEVLTNMTPEQLQDPAAVDALFESYITKAGEREAIEYKRSKAQREELQSAVPNVEESFNTGDFKSYLKGQAQQPVAADATAQTQQVERDPEYQQAPKTRTTKDTPTNLELEEYKTRVAQSVAGNLIEDLQKNESLQDKLSLIEDSNVQLEQLKAKIEANPNDTESVEKYNFLADQYNQTIQDEDVQKYAKAGALIDNVYRKTENYINEFPMSYQERVRKQAEQDKINALFDSEAQSMGRGAASALYGIRYIPRAATGFIGDLANLVTHLDFDNQYGKMDAMNDWISGAVDNFNDMVMPLPDQVNKAPFVLYDKDGKMQIDGAMFMPSLLKTGADMGALLFGAGKISSGIKGLSKASKFAKVTDKTADLAGLYTSTFVQTFDDYYQAAMETNKLSPNEAKAVAFIQSGTEALIETFNPQAYLFSSTMRNGITKQVVRDILNGTAPKEAVKSAMFTTLKEAGKELGEEYLQTAKDFLVQASVNKLKDQDAYDNNYKDLLAELVTVSILTPFLAGGPAAVTGMAQNANRHGLYNDAIKMVAADKQTLMPILKQKMVEAGATPEQVATVLRDINQREAKTTGRAYYAVNDEEVTKEEIAKRIEERKFDGIEIINDEQTAKLYHESWKEHDATRPKTAMPKRATVESDNKSIDQFVDGAKKLQPENAQRMERLGKTFKAVSAVLSKVVPNLGFVVHRDNDAAVQWMKDNNKQVNDGDQFHGFYSDGKIHIVANQYNDSTPLHEAVHPIINALRETNPDLYGRLINQSLDMPFIKSAEDGAPVSFRQYVDQTYPDLANESDEEKMVMFIEDFLDNNIDYDRLGESRDSVMQKIKDMVEQFMVAIGFKDKLDLNKAEDLRDALKMMTKAFREGKAIKVSSNNTDSTENIITPEQAEQPYTEGVEKPGTVQTSKVKQGEGLIPKNYDIDEDGNDFLFYHYGDIKGDKIDPKFHGKNRYTSDKRRNSVSYFYTKANQQESMVSGKPYVVRVPKNKVYPFNKDPLGLYEQAKRNFEKDFPKGAFGATQQIDYMNPLIAKAGYDMVVAKWGPFPLRAETIKPLKFDKDATKRMQEFGGLKNTDEINKAKIDAINQVSEKVNTNPKLASEYYSIKGDKLTGVLKSPSLTKLIRPSTLNKIQPATQVQASKKPVQVQTIDNEISEEAERLALLPMDSEDGSTFNTEGTRYTGVGIVLPVVSKNYESPYLPTTEEGLDKLTPDSMPEFIGANQDKIMDDSFKVGFYKFPGKNQISADLNIIVPESQKELAIKIGRYAGQKSLFNLADFSYIETGADGSSPKEFTNEELKQISDSLKKGELPGFVQASRKTIPTVKIKETKTKPAGFVEPQYIKDFIGDNIKAINSQAINTALLFSEGSFNYNAQGENFKVKLLYSNDKAFKKIRSLKSKISDLKPNDKSRTKLLSDLKKEATNVILDVKSFMKSNLQELLNSATPEFIDKAKEWYVGANKIAQKIADDFGMTLEQASATLAALSPQKEWNNNISMAIRSAEIINNKSDFVLDKNVFNNAKKKFANDNFLSYIEKLEESNLGRSINDMSDYISKGIAVRVIDSVFNDPKIDSYSPEGTIFRKLDENVAWGTPEEVAKAVMVLQGEDVSVISDAPKVRSFYNNIVDPFNEMPYVTVDTHASSAALMMPINAEETGRLGLFNAGENLKNTLIREAYEEVAKENGLLPREFQSVIWELQRAGLNHSGRQQSDIDSYNKLVDQTKGLSHEQRAREIIRRHKSEDYDWAREAGITYQKSDYPWTEVSEYGAEQEERSGTTIPERGSEPVRGSDTEVVSAITGLDEDFPADWNIQGSKQREKLNKTAQRISLDESTIYKEIQKEVLSNPQRYMYTQQDLKNKKMDFQNATDADIISNVANNDKLLAAIDFDNNFGVLAAIELINRYTAAGIDTKPIFDKLRALGTTVGQLLRQFAELKTATPEGIIKIVEKAMESRGAKLTKQQADDLQVIARDFIKKRAQLGEAQNNFQQTGSEQDLKKVQDKQKELDKSFNDLHRYVAKVTPFGMDRLLSTILQGNLLKTTSIGANIVGNVLYLPVRKFELMAGDVGGYLLAKKNGYMPIDPISTFVGAEIAGAREFWRSMPTVFMNALKGNINDASNKTFEVSRGLHPFTALWQVFTKAGRATLPTKRGVIEKLDPVTGKVTRSYRSPLDRIKPGIYAEKLLEGSYAGMNAELMFRLLYLGDAPFKNSARTAAAYRLYARTGGKKKHGSFEAFLAKPDKDRATYEEQKAMEATFSDDRTLAKIADSGVKAIHRMMSHAAEAFPPGAMRDNFNTLSSLLIKANIPFVRVPANLVQVMIELTMPLIPLAAGIRYSKSNPEKGAILIARAALGMSFIYLADMLIEGGSVIAGGEGDKDEERQAKFETAKPNTINIDAAYRIITGTQDVNSPAKEGDRYVEYYKLGVLGVAMVSRAKFRENVKDKGEEYNDMLFHTKAIEQINSAARGTLELSFLQGTSAFIEAIKDKGLENYFAELSNTAMAIPLPNNITSFTMANREYMLRAKDKDFAQNFIEKQSTKIYPALKDNVPGVYPVISMWGNPTIQNEPESAYTKDMSPWVRQFFDITKSGTIQDQLTVELWNLSSRTNEFPVTAPSRGVRLYDEATDSFFEAQMDEGDYVQAQMIAGQLKRMYIMDLVQDPEWATMTDEEKIEDLKAESNAANNEALSFIKDRIFEMVEEGKIVLDKKNKKYSYLQIRTPDLSELQKIVEENK